MKRGIQPKLWILTTILSSLLLLAGQSTAGEKERERKSPTVKKGLVPAVTFLSEEQLSRFAASSESMPVPFGVEAKDTTGPATEIRAFLSVPGETSLPQRPAITPSEPLERPTTEIVAGVGYRYGTLFHLNLGYVVPSSQLQGYIEPLGLSLTDDSETRKIVLGVDISF